MNYLSITFLVLLLTLLVFTGFSLFTAIHGNFRHANELRRHFSQRIRLLPLFKLLQAQSISLEQWLHQAPVSTIDSAIRQCESCRRTDECLVLFKRKDSGGLDHCQNDALAGFMNSPGENPGYITA